jgi:hypothetical protein
MTLHRVRRPCFGRGWNRECQTSQAFVADSNHGLAAISSRRSVAHRVHHGPADFTNAAGKGHASNRRGDRRVTLGRGAHGPESFPLVVDAALQRGQR